MPSENQQGDSDSPYGGDTDLRILHEGNDKMVTGLIRGVTDIERAQKLIKQECMNQHRNWVVRKLKARITAIAEGDA